MVLLAHHECVFDKLRLYIIIIIYLSGWASLSLASLLSFELAVLWRVRRGLAASHRKLHAKLLFHRWHLKVFASRRIFSSNTFYKKLMWAGPYRGLKAALSIICPQLLLFSFHFMGPKPIISFTTTTTLKTGSRFPFPFPTFVINCGITPTHLNSLSSVKRHESLHGLCRLCFLFGPNFLNFNSI